MKFLKTPLSLKISLWLVNLFIASLAIVSVIHLFNLYIFLFDWKHMPNEPPLSRLGIISTSSFSLIVTIFGCISLLIFRKFIRNVKIGQVFTNRNVTLLKRMPIYLAAYCLLSVITNWLFIHYICEPMEWDPRPVFNSFHGFILTLALLTWVLAYVFSIGFDMQKERDLTI